MGDGFNKVNKHMLTGAFIIRTNGCFAVIFILRP